MRLWSLHPRYLDSKGLVACWREGLLARKVLRGETKGYKNHPQLERFKTQSAPLTALDNYLWDIWEEATRRRYAFNRKKLGPRLAVAKIEVSDGQLAYELQHLKAKLKARDMAQYEKVAQLTDPLPHPIFCVVAGGIASWEKIREEQQEAPR